MRLLRKNKRPADAPPGAEAPEPSPGAGEPVPVIRFGPETGIAPAPVRALAFDREGFLWAGTEAGLFVSDARSWARVDPGPAGGAPGVSALLAHSDGSLWVGTDGGGLLRRQDGEWARHDAASGLPDDRVTCLVEAVGRDGRPVVWAGTRGGLGRFQDRSGWTAFRESDGLPSDDVTSIVATTGATGDRVLWIGTARGLARFERTHWARFDTSSGLASDDVRSLLMTAGGAGNVLWVGTSGGLVRSERRRWYPVTAAGLEGACVTALLEAPTPSGATGLWIGTEDRGLLLLEGGGAAAGPEGLPGGPVLALAGPADDGGDRAVWIGTGRGLAAVDLTRGAAGRTPRPLRITRTLAGGEPVALGGRDALPYAPGAVTFEYALLAFARPGETRYRTQLAGLEKRPSEWTAEASRTVDGLAPGTYELRVWARDWAGLESGPERLQFRVAAPPRRGRWASLLFAGAAAGLAYGAVRYGRGGRDPQEEPDPDAGGPEPD